VTVALGLIMTPLVDKIYTKEMLKNNKKITPLGRLESWMNLLSVLWEYT